MTSTDLAQLFVKCSQLRDKSWNGSKYTKSLLACAEEVTDDTFIQQVLYVSLTYSGELVDAALQHLKPH